MSIDPITSEKMVRKITTWDLEWFPGAQSIDRGLDGAIIDRSHNLGDGLRLCGAYDERNGYRHYKTIEQFLDGEFTSESAGRWFYAHAGGLADIQFVLQAVMENPNYSVEASFSGSSAIICNITRGDKTWHCVDSYWLLRDKLANIAKAVGLKKLDDYQCSNFPLCGHIDPKNPDKCKCIFYAPDNILLTYNEQDCFILWKAIVEFESTMLSIGGQLQKTIASTAMDFFRRQFLHRAIETSPEVNLLARQAYTSSRVEVFQSECKESNYYDFNSSFPYSMTLPHPGQVIKTDTQLSDADDAIYLAECDLTVPECYLPPIPYRNRHRVFFPHGSWRGWFSSVDLRLAEKRGCKIDNVGKVVHFEPRTDLAAYAYTVYDRRLEAQKRGASFEAIVYKYLLNSLYGKFAEAREKTKMQIRPKFTTCQHNPRHSNDQCIDVIQPGVLIITEEVDIPHEWVPIAVHITAHSRALLEGAMHTCQSDLYYVDTDSVVTTHSLPTGSQLGQLKLEMMVQEGTFVAPKLYRVKGNEINKDGSLKPVDKVKAKGFSRLTPDEFFQLRDGVEVGIESMMRIRELFKRGEHSPMEKVFGKAYRGLSRPKRCPTTGTQTRPWHIDEIQQKYKLPPGAPAPASLVETWLKAAGTAGPRP